MRALVCVGLFALTACGSDFLPASYISGLRVIDVVAEPPEIPAGATSQLHVTLSPGFEDAAIAWTMCRHPTFPGAGLINPDCLDETPQPYLVPLPGAAGSDITVTMPMVTAPDLGFPDSSTGFYLPLRMIIDKGDQHLRAFYRLRFYLGPLGGQAPNRNPHIDGLVADLGADSAPATPLTDGFIVPGGGKVTLAALLSPDSAETYTRVKDIATMELETLTEQLRVRWYANAGAFDPDVTGLDRPATTLDFAQRSPSSLPADVDVWCVVADERGGSDVRHVLLHVQ